MNPMTQLDQIRRQMVEDLTQIPQYRALKAIERFIGEMSALYEQDPADETSDDPEVASAQQKIAQAIENHVRGEVAPAIVKNASYLPVHRVA